MILPSEVDQSKEYLWKYMHQLRMLPKKWLVYGVIMDNSNRKLTRQKK